MPVPIDAHSSMARRLSLSSNDISFDPYDFESSQPTTEIKDESRELEEKYCRDFACCGLILDDLHDLLQHYEECHVRVEDEDDEDVFTPEDPLQELDPLEDLAHMKKRAAAYLDDLPSLHLIQPLPSPADSPSCSSAASVSSESDILEDDKPKVGKKRTYYQSNAVEIITQSAVKKLALATNIQPHFLSDEEFFAHAEAFLATAHLNINADKPYKCPVDGCDKAYKNPNGLKYHNQHGHCSLITEDENVAKPYQCTIGDCGKRYKNLNGLKYHIEHSHVAALNQTLASFGSSFFSPTPDVTPISSPQLSCLSPIF
ncbi:hypothetical protein DM01DRAFT_1332745 [Hesseltinella vesiculosa]|uniref:C2H2-type domain-containing protein n=1 Tax=Hesseltinella vesiculosa TaxID=101127 RepID=A0A1X2GT82_9FUNG|nr:hypothetical protein DM01DRAFT_1332745 [Hesseltinella vesiculosa]